MKQPKTKILFAVLNWGLGHATRSLPIIKALAKKHKLSIASDGAALELLRAELPGFHFYTLPGYGISYPYKSMMFNALLQYKQLRQAINAEQRALQTLLSRVPFDLLISDNRYGIHSPRVRSILISHQLHLQTFGVQRLLKAYTNKVLHHYLAPFDELWIPDAEGEPNLSGSLSHDLHSSLPSRRYIGPWSRLYKPGESSSSPEVEKQRFDVLFIISGPEPHRSKLEQQALRLFRQRREKVAIVRGLSPGSTARHEGNITLFNNLNYIDLHKLIRQSDHIISRSGYSSIMDYCALGQSAILLPTPGQSEQRYLAHLHHQKRHFVSLNPGRLSADSILCAPDDFKPPKLVFNQAHLIDL